MWKLICNVYRFNNTAAAVVKMHLKIKVVRDTLIWMLKMRCDLGSKNKEWFAFGYFINDIYLRGDFINIYCTFHLLKNAGNLELTISLYKRYIKSLKVFWLFESLLWDTSYWPCLLLGVTIASMLSTLGCFLALWWEAFVWSHSMVSR